MTGEVRWFFLGLGIGALLVVFWLRVSFKGLGYRLQELDKEKRALAQRIRKAEDLEHSADAYHEAAKAGAEKIKEIQAEAEAKLEELDRWIVEQAGAANRLGLGKEHGKPFRPSSPPPVVPGFLKNLVLAVCLFLVSPVALADTAPTAAEPWAEIGLVDYGGLGAGFYPDGTPKPDLLFARDTARVSVVVFGVGDGGGINLHLVRRRVDFYRDRDDGGPLIYLYDSVNDDYRGGWEGPQQAPGDSGYYHFTEPTTILYNGQPYHYQAGDRCGFYLTFLPPRDASALIRPEVIEYKVAAWLSVLEDIGNPDRVGVFLDNAQGQFWQTGNLQSGGRTDAPGSPRWTKAEMQDIDRAGVNNYVEALDAAGIPVLSNTRGTWIQAGEYMGEGVYSNPDANELLWPPADGGQDHLDDRASRPGSHDLYVARVGYKDGYNDTRRLLSLAGFRLVMQPDAPGAQHVPLELFGVDSRSGSLTLSSWRDHNAAPVWWLADAVTPHDLTVAAAGQDIAGRTFLAYQRTWSGSDPSRALHAVWTPRSYSGQRGDDEANPEQRRPVVTLPEGDWFRIVDPYTAELSPGTYSGTVYMTAGDAEIFVLASGAVDPPPEEPPPVEPPPVEPPPIEPPPQLQPGRYWIRFEGWIEIVPDSTKAEPEP